jgi:hypothetical protein
MFSSGGGGSANTLTVGGLCIPTSGLKILKTSVTGNAVYSIFYDATPQAGAAPGIYVVPALKNFVMYAAVFWPQQAASTDYSILLLQGDNISGGGTGLNQAAPTNPISMVTGMADSVADRLCSNNTQSGVLPYEFAIGGRLRAGKYGYAYGVATGNGGSVLLYGYEVAGT